MSCHGSFTPTMRAMAQRRPARLPSRKIHVCSSLLAGELKQTNKISRIDPVYTTSLTLRHMTQRYDKRCFDEHLVLPHQIPRCLPKASRCSRR